MYPFLLAALVVFFDQLTKAIAVSNLHPGESRIAINKILSFTLIHNTGAAFGLFKNQTFAFILISGLAILFMSFYLIKKKATFYVPLALILGGAVGNVIDRLRFGHVIDFIDVHFWPVFNIADSCITVGAFILFILILRGKDAPRTI